MIPKNNTIAELMEMEEDYLLFELGRGLHKQKGNLQRKNVSRKNEIGFAKKWLDKNMIAFKQKICRSEIVELYQKDSKRVTDIELISTIGDIILTSWALPAPLIISVLIFKSGINHLCDE